MEHPEEYIEHFEDYDAYYKGKLLHREDGPAIIWKSGIKEWYINDLPHREDGPAVEYPDGDKLWYYHGEYIECTSQEEFERLVKLKIFW